jgi:hypothetical protein
MFYANVKYIYVLIMNEFIVHFLALFNNFFSAAYFI